MVAKSQKVDALTVRKGFEELSNLSHEEYGVTIFDLLADQDLTQEQKSLRIGRLMGVMIKQPFSEQHPIAPAKSRTGALRTWELKEANFAKPELVRTWQYDVLEIIRKEAKFSSVQDLAGDAQRETGFFWYLARSCHKYICGDQAMKQTISAAVSQGSVLITPQGFLNASGTAIAIYLVQAVPWLTPAAAPLIAGIVVIIGTIGLDAFCGWTASPPGMPEA